MTEEVKAMKEVRVMKESREAAPLSMRVPMELTRMEEEEKHSNPNERVTLHELKIGFLQVDSIRH